MNKYANTLIDTIIRSINTESNYMRITSDISINNQVYTESYPVEYVVFDFKEYQGDNKNTSIHSVANTYEEQHKLANEFIKNTDASKVNALNIPFRILIRTLIKTNRSKTQYIIIETVKEKDKPIRKGKWAYKTMLYEAEIRNREFKKCNQLGYCGITTILGGPKDALKSHFEEIRKCMLYRKENQ